MKGSHASFDVVTCGVKTLLQCLSLNSQVEYLDSKQARPLDSLLNETISFVTGDFLELENKELFEELYALRLVMFVVINEV